MPGSTDVSRTAATCVPSRMSHGAPWSGRIATFGTSDSPFSSPYRSDRDARSTGHADADGPLSVGACGGFRRVREHAVWWSGSASCATEWRRRREAGDVTELGAARHAATGAAEAVDARGPRGHVSASASLQTALAVFLAIHSKMNGFGQGGPRGNASVSASLQIARVVW